MPTMLFVSRTDVWKRKPIMRVEFLEFLRPEEKFASEKALYEQIDRDLATARERISFYSPIKY